MDDEGPDWKPLFVGSVVGGATRENLPIRQAISRIARVVNSLEFRVADETGVDVVFHVPGPLMQPNYQGIRAGRYSKPQRLIAIQLAVHAGLALRGDGQILRSLVSDVVKAADLAATTAARRPGALPVLQAVALAGQVLTVLGSTDAIDGR